MSEYTLASIFSLHLDMSVHKARRLPIQQRRNGLRPSQFSSLQKPQHSLHTSGVTSLVANPVPPLVTIKFIKSSPSDHARTCF